MRVNKPLLTTAKYPQVRFGCFVDRKLVFEKQFFVGSPSVKSRSACICETLPPSVSCRIDRHKIKKDILEPTMNNFEEYLRKGEQNKAEKAKVM